MSKARLVITAVVFEKRPVREVCEDYAVSRSWVYELVARYRNEGETAFEPRSKRPRTSPSKTPDEVIELIVATRRRLSGEGLDSGMGTIRWHLEHHHQVSVSESTIHRTLVAAGLVVPAPKKRPRTSYVRFQAEQPNECWQADMTHVRLADGADVEVLTWLDDHSRDALSVTTHRRVSSQVVVDTFTAATNHHGVPASTLTDNGLYFTTRFAGGGTGGRNGFETLLVELGVTQKNSRPNHPTTCGKVERFQQTMKHWLRARPAPASIDELRTLIDRFVDDYNHHRPHRSLPHRSPPAVAYQARPKAGPTARHDVHHRVRRDVVDAAGKVTLRHHGRLYKIGIGRTRARTPIIMLVADLHVRVLDAATGDTIRTLTLDTSRSYQPTGRAPGAPRKRTNPNPT